MSAVKKDQTPKLRIKLKSYDAMVGVANGNSTKIIVPSDLQGLVTAGTVLKETIKEKEK